MLILCGLVDFNQTLCQVFDFVKKCVPQAIGIKVLKNTHEGIMRRQLAFLHQPSLNKPFLLHFHIAGGVIERSEFALQCKVETDKQKILQLVFDLHRIPKTFPIGWKNIPTEFRSSRRHFTSFILQSVLIKKCENLVCILQLWRIDRIPADGNLTEITDEI